jgi:hypothetical protein
MSLALPTSAPHIRVRAPRCGAAQQRSTVAAGVPLLAAKHSVYGTPLLRSPGASRARGAASTRGVSTTATLNFEALLENLVRMYPPFPMLCATTALPWSDPLAPVRTVCARVNL